MNIENAKKRLLDSENELSYSQRVAIVDLIERLNTPKHETVEELEQFVRDFRSLTIMTEADSKDLGITLDKLVDDSKKLINILNHHGKPEIEG